MTIVAAVQLNSSNNVAQNLAKATAIIKSAAARGAHLIALPENFVFIGTHEKDKLAMQESLDGAIIGHFCMLAKDLQVNLLLGGFQERSDDPQRPYNTCVCIDAQGSICATYRKIHLFDVALGDAGNLTESRHTSAGETAVVVPMAGLHLGLSICYDLRFGKLYETLVDAGADVLSIPAAFTLHTGKDHWEVLLRARAIEFQSFVIAPAQFGRHNERRHSYGNAMIVDPWGTVLARCAEEEGFCCTEIDISRVQRVRQQIPSLANRRRIAKVSG